VAYRLIAEAEHQLLRSAADRHEARGSQGATGGSPD
jgi:hypothetical protein